MFKNILKGIIIGIAKIVPGVSGSMIAISFGVYKPTLETISNLKKLTFNKIKFLISLFL
ncbi:MAG: DUF368 domain-containing protein [Bacilli bacterium]|nr:DUF368 domain-containing protein [Bacilli bacterium]